MSLKDALADTTTWVAVADANGVVAFEWASSGRLRRQLATADVETGTELGEEKVGRNGIGHALSTRSASIVKGTQHVNEDWYNLACAASPVIHPVSRELMGVINITCLAEEHNAHLRITLQALLSGIGQALLTRSQARHQRLLDAHLRVKRGARGLVLTLDAHTMIVDDALGSAALSREALWGAVTGLSPSATEVALPGGGRAQIVPVVRDRWDYGFSLIMGSRCLPSDLESGGSSKDSVRGRRLALSPLEQAEFDVIAAVMQEHHGNKSEVAARLQISRGTLYDRLRRYGLAEHGSRSAA